MSAFQNDPKQISIVTNTARAISIQATIWNKIHIYFIFDTFYLSVFVFFTQPHTHTRVLSFLLYIDIHMYSGRIFTPFILFNFFLFSIFISLSDKFWRPHIIALNVCAVVMRWKTLHTGLHTWNVQTKENMKHKPWMKCKK